MTIATHAVLMDGRSALELKPLMGGSMSEELCRRIKLLNGQSPFALLLWRLPHGVHLGEYDLKNGPDDWMQCAGGSEGRYTCEMRSVAPDGRVTHETLGLAEHAEAQTWTVVPYAEHEARVLQSEVLGIDEVCELFEAYRTDEPTPARYARRAIAP